jgi:hypothetical protein
MLDDDDGPTVDSLLDTIEGCADWRMRAAREYPADPRHRDASRELRALASWVREHRDAASVRAIIAVQARNRDLDLTWPIGGGAGGILSQYGFGLRGRPRASTFLWDLAFALTDDVDEARSRQWAE